MIDALIGFVGVIVGALITTAKDLWVDRRSRRKNAEYLSIRIVSLLDRFIEGCADVVNDDGLRCGQPNSGGFRQQQVSTPKFEVQSIDVDWKTIPANLMYEILSFPDFVNAANHRIHGAFEYVASPPDYEEGFEERQYQYAMLGLRASKISDKLRSTYGIPERKHDDWDPIKYLSEHRKQLEEGRARSR